MGGARLRGLRGGAAVTLFDVFLLIGIPLLLILCPPLLMGGRGVGGGDYKPPPPPSDRE